MANTQMRYVLWVAVLAISGICSGEILLHDTWADASRLETNLPDESAVWISHPDDVAMGVGSLTFAQGGSSTKMWTYFAPDGAPVSLGVGQQLIATIEFTPRGALYNTTSRNFRFGLFNDPTDPHILEDINSDSGGAGNPWMDATGYAVQLALSAGPSSTTVALGKRTGLTTTSLLGSGGAYTSVNGGAPIVAELDTRYILTLELDRIAADQMRVTFTFADEQGVLSTHSILDDGIGDLPIYTDFDQLFFRMSQASGTADVLDYHSIKIEHIVPIDYGPPVGIPHDFPAVDSCRTEFTRPNDVRRDSTKLSVRGDATAAKSWIRFNIGEPNAINLRAAFLTVVLIEDRSGTFDVSAVNDDCYDNFNWSSGDLTWNNAPANDTASHGALDPDKSTYVGSLTIVGGMTGDAYSIDVTDIIEADTDGIVQFVLHNSTALLNFGTHNHPIVDYRPVLTLIEATPGADYPLPYYGMTVETSLAQLSWRNPEPNEPSGQIYCDVYLGTEPNLPVMDKVSVGPDVSSVAINTDNFPNFGVLQNRTTYYWRVDVYDTSVSAEPIVGLWWWFYTDDNEPPQVDAGLNQAVWLGMSGVAGEETITLYGITSDDGLPDPPGYYTVLWEQIDSDAPTVAIINADQDVATLTVTERGVYVFRLTADDGEEQTSDTVTIYVGDNACDASHLSTGEPYLPGDVNRDCIVNLEDFAILFSQAWLNCTDVLTNCGL